MKTSTLKAFAQTNSRGDSSTWALLDAISKAAGDDRQKAKRDVEEFLVVVCTRCAILAHNDQVENIDKNIRNMLSRLNEEYPFDVVAVNNQVRKLFNAYISSMYGMNSYAEAKTLCNMLENISNQDEMETSPSTPEQIHAWDYLDPM